MNEAGRQERKGAGTPLYGKELSPGWRWALRILSPLAFIALWQLLCSVHSLGATPSPVDVSRALWHLLDQGDPVFGRSIWAHILNSLYRVLAGFAIAALAGVGLGLLMGWYRVVYYVLHPLVEMLRPIPPFAWIVLAILWFKIGNAPAIFIVFLGAFFPILLNTVSGVESFDRVLGEAAVTLGASRHQVLKKVVLPLRSAPDLHRPAGWPGGGLDEPHRGGDGGGRGGGPGVDDPIDHGLLEAGLCRGLHGHHRGHGFHTRLFDAPGREVLPALEVRKMPLLEIDDLHKTYTGRRDLPDLEALSGISLGLEEGGLTCIVGPSGCGKTTLLKIVAGLETATSGRVLLEGREIEGAGARVGLVFQQFALFPGSPSCATSPSAWRCREA